MQHTRLFAMCVAGLAIAFGGAFAQQVEEAAPDPALAEMQPQQGVLTSLCESYLRIDRLLMELDPDWARQPQWREAEPAMPEEEVEPAAPEDEAMPEEEVVPVEEEPIEPEAVEPAEPEVAEPLEPERIGVADFDTVRQHCQIFAAAAWQELQELPGLFVEQPIEPVERPEVDVTADVAMAELRLIHERLATAISQLVGFQVDVERPLIIEPEVEPEVDPVEPEVEDPKVPEEDPEDPEEDNNSN